MIFDAVLSFLVNVLEGVLSLIPTFEVDLDGFGSSIGGGVAAANSLFPVVTLGLCIAAAVGLRLFLVFVAFLGWVWDKVPFTFK